MLNVAYSPFMLSVILLSVVAWRYYLAVAFVKIAFGGLSWQKLKLSYVCLVRFLTSGIVNITSSF